MGPMLSDNDGVIEVTGDQAFRDAAAPVCASLVLGFEAHWAMTLSSARPFFKHLVILRQKGGLKDVLRLFPHPYAKVFRLLGLSSSLCQNIADFAGTWLPMHWFGPAGPLRK